MGLVKLVIGISLINLCGIVALLSLTANQDFDCGVSSKAPVKETAHSVENADGKVQGSFEPTLPGSPVCHICEYRCFLRFVERSHDRAL